MSKILSEIVVLFISKILFPTCSAVDFFLEGPLCCVKIYIDDCDHCVC